MFDFKISIFLLICFSLNHGQVLPYTHGESKNRSYNLTFKGNRTRKLDIGLSKDLKSPGLKEGFQGNVYHNSESTGVKKSEIDDSNNTDKVERLRGSSNVTLGDTIGVVDFNSLFRERAREDAYNLSSPSESPYSVLLISAIGEIVGGLCTGSLLTDEWVLSAAHCVATPGVTRVVVVAGGNSIQEIIDRKPAEGSQIINSTEFYSHPKYSEYKSMYDVSVIKTEKRFDLSNTVNTIKLSTQPWTYHSYVNCKFTGFGVVQMNEDRTDDVARKTHRLFVKKPCLCSFRFKASRMSSVEVNTWICTKPVEDFGVCQGDSGGGLVCDGEVKAVAMLLMSGIDNHKTCEISKFWKKKCGAKNTVSVFQDSCPFLRWINSYVRLYNESDISSSCVEPEESG